jgi:2-polyprenyl-3-methyl-5-hydroxy-6-metoxy-1,4-benzoquinol methylase
MRRLGVAEMARESADRLDGRMVSLVSPTSGDRLTRTGSMLVSSSGEQFPIVGEIPRFVRSESYAASFGLEWQVHSDTQLDSRTGTRISRDRLDGALGQTLASLREKTVLEAGCGAGRFTELMVQSGAYVHAIDLSVAVEANRRNIGDRPNYVVAQADLTRPPFPRQSFDVVLCLGVLQHTPSPEASIRALWQMVKPGGRIVFDHYSWDLSIVTKLAPLYRLVINKLPATTAKRTTDRLVDLWFPLHWSVRRTWPLQALLSRVSPCQVYFKMFPHLTRAQHRELCRLDTFDQLADRYKRLRTVRQIRRTLMELDAEEIEVRRGGNGIEARARKPLTLPAGKRKTRHSDMGER